LSKPKLTKSCTAEEEEEQITNLKGSQSGDQDGHGKKTVKGIKGKESLIVCIWIGRGQSSPVCFQDGNVELCNARKFKSHDQG